MVVATTHWDVFMTWLVHTSWQASLLIGLILLVQKIAGRWLGVRGRYCLWLLVLIRMVMPYAASSRASLYNVLPLSPMQEYQSQAARTRMRMDSVATQSHNESTTTESTVLAASPASASSSTQSEIWFKGQLRRGLIVDLLSFAWLAGVCLLVTCIAMNHVRLRSIVRRGRIVTDRWVLRLLADCKRLIGTRADVDVIVTSVVGSPALFGLVHPKLLLPRETLARRDREELRHIFLHELAHLKRHDVLVGHIVTALHVLHWFNPVIALAFRRMRADRELASDGLALSVLDGDEAIPYSRTLVLQAEQLVWSQPRWVLTGLSADKRQLKQRIAMISPKQKPVYRWSLLAILLFDVLALVGLTDAVTRYEPRVFEFARDYPTTCQDRHANIIRIWYRHRGTGKCLAAYGDRVACDRDEPGLPALWEARFDGEFGGPTEIVYLYSVASRKYLRWDRQGNVAANGCEPNETTRWIVRNLGDAGTSVEPYPDMDLFLAFDTKESRVVLAPIQDVWNNRQLWRVKVSDDPKSNPQWRNGNVPGPDWYVKNPLPRRQSK